MKLLVQEVTFKQALPLRGTVAYINTAVDHWKGWSIYADTDARELVVTMPTGQSSRRLRVPFENVLFWVPGAVAPKTLTQEVLPKFEGLD